MDTRLNEALEFTDFSVAFADRKRLLKQKFQTATIHYHNGGKFTITRELLNFVDNMVNKDIDYAKTSSILIDDADNPIEIENIKSFAETINDMYFKALNEYHTELQKARKERDAKGLL